MQTGVDRLVQASVDRLGPVRRVREEMTSLRTRLEQLESSLSELEESPAVSAVSETDEHTITTLDTRKATR
jgi:hypothetical protein